MPVYPYSFYPQIQYMYVIGPNGQPVLQPVYSNPYMYMNPLNPYEKKDVEYVIPKSTPDSLQIDDNGNKLPYGVEKRYTKSGKPYYVDHTKRITCWSYPPESTEEKKKKLDPVKKNN